MAGLHARLDAVRVVLGARRIQSQPAHLACPGVHAVTGAKLFDLYNPRGIHKSHLTQENKPYFPLIKKVWRITPFGVVRE